MSAVGAVHWGDFRAQQPELAAHVEERLGHAPAYLGTIRKDGWPRVHPVGPLIPRNTQLVVPMYPTSPKGNDLRRTGRYALHCDVEDTQGGGGEVLITGTAREIEPTEDDLASGYVAFELLVSEVLAIQYDPNDLSPRRTRWKA